MATTTSIYGWPVPELTDDPNGPAQISALANAVEDTVFGTTNVGVPSDASTSLSPTAWTIIASVSFTLDVDKKVEIVGWARLVNTGAGRPIVALQIVREGGTHLFGIGQSDVWGTGDATGTNISLVTPRRRVTLAAGSHTLYLLAYKDGAGTIDAKKTSSLGSQDIAVTGIEASY